MDRHTQRFWPLVLGSLTSLAACGSFAPPADDSNPQGPATPPSAQQDGQEAAQFAALESKNRSLEVASVTIEADHTVQILEPQPGILVYVERALPTSKFVLPEQPLNDAVKVFAALNPAASVPDSLRAASNRALALAIDAPAAPSVDAHSTLQVSGGSPASSGRVVVSGDPSLGVVQQAISSSDPVHFVDEQGGCEWNAAVLGNSSANLCRVDWANGFVSSLTARMQTVHIDHYAGNGVIVRMQVNTTVTDTAIPVHMTAFLATTTGGTVLRRVDVLNADGDSFHIGTTFHP